MYVIRTVIYCTIIWNSGVFGSYFMKGSTYPYLYTSASEITGTPALISLALVVSLIGQAQLLISSEVATLFSSTRIIAHTNDTILISLFPVRSKSRLSSPERSRNDRSVFRPESSSFSEARQIETCTRLVSQ